VLDPGPPPDEQTCRENPLAQLEWELRSLKHAAEREAAERPAALERHRVALADAKQRIHALETQLVQQPDWRAFGEKLGPQSTSADWNRAAQMQREEQLRAYRVALKDEERARNDITRLESADPDYDDVIRLRERHLDAFRHEYDVIRLERAVALREGAAKHAEMVQEGRALRRGSEEQLNAARRRMLGGVNGSTS
jgi:hypothetical protein